ncbi:ChrA protein [Bacillus manliponensis]|uniref:ChrA protein n=1 Tax=Bacillus manliponensis TaxID=574376 RepID=A0A073K2K8_9BACI|nr:chromate efflux transporter [Bacillus manliponensis]KEK20735.1 ChrA protein [Bacillus manliponensis]
MNRIRVLWEILMVSTKLGLMSFGGPVAHLGYFHEEYVKRKKWMDEKTYADLVALCQFLPGPASSQVGIGIGLTRSGLLGGILAWIGFTMPSVIALIVFASLLQSIDVSNAGWIHGLKIVAVVIVAHAVLGMGKKLAPDRGRATIAVVAMIVTLLWQVAFSSVVVIIIAGIIGFLFYKKEGESAPAITVPISKSTGTISLILFFGLLLLLPVLRHITTLEWIAVFDSFYRAGSLVFGGGHVVLPLLEKEIVSMGWVSKEEFLAGYGATQAVPGPLFTFAAYLGAVMGGWSMAMLATIAIFLPAFLLVIGTLPFWSILRSKPKAQGALTGMNAAVVGILLAALYHPIWTSSILAAKDFALAAVLFCMLQFWKLPPWVIVIAGVLGGVIITL